MYRGFLVLTALTIFLAVLGYTKFIFVYVAYMLVFIAFCHIDIRRMNRETAEMMAELEERKRRARNQTM